MLRTVQSLPRTGLSTLRFDTRAFPPAPAACYRAPWRLPGPDSHRQATTSLRRSATLYDVTSSLLGARKAEARQWPANCTPAVAPVHPRPVTTANDADVGAGSTEAR